MPPSSHPVAAIDLGSNSFHLVLAHQRQGRVEILDRIKERIHLRAGLDAGRQLDADAAQRAIDCLKRFRQRIHGLEAENVRAVGTKTFRLIRMPRDFVAEAEIALGYSIEIISGQEEARLIYQGVRFANGDFQQPTLIADIGGGSTEIMLGQGTRPLLAESVSVGSSGWTIKWFKNGEIRDDLFSRAILEAQLEMEPIGEQVRNHGWDSVIGSSGTILAISRILEQNKWSTGAITADGLDRLREAVLKYSTLEELTLAGLKDNRRPSFLGGFSILCAFFKLFGLEKMHTSQGALREGLLLNLIGRLTHSDIRARSVQALAQRFDVDFVQADRVVQTVHALFTAAHEVWGLDRQAGLFLEWAAMLHEVGLILNHSGFHRHGAYLVENTDLPGFSRTEQALLAKLILHHRRRLRLEDVATVSHLPLILLLRLSVALHRSRTKLPQAVWKAKCANGSLELQFDPLWLSKHPLTAADIQNEALQWEGTKYALKRGEFSP